MEFVTNIGPIGCSFCRLKLLSIVDRCSIIKGWISVSDRWHWIEETRRYSEVDTRGMEFPKYWLACSMLGSFVEVSNSSNLGNEGMKPQIMCYVISFEVTHMLDDERGVVHYWGLWLSLSRMTILLRIWLKSICYHPDLGWTPYLGFVPTIWTLWGVLSLFPYCFDLLLELSRTIFHYFTIQPLLLDFEIKMIYEMMFWAENYCFTNARGAYMISELSTTKGQMWGYYGIGLHAATGLYWYWYEA